MSDDRLDEILARLDGLEGDRDGAQTDRGPGPPPRPAEDDRAPGPPGLGAGFDEKRVIDLIVSLVVEQTDRMFAARLDELRIDEARLGDQIAGKVMKRLQEGMRRQAKGLQEAEGGKKSSKAKKTKRGPKGSKSKKSAKSSKSSKG